MNKQEITAVAILFAILIGWGVVNRGNLTPPPPTAVEPQATSESSPTASAPPQAPAAAVATLVPAVTADAEPVAPMVVLPPEVVVELKSDVAAITVSSHGAGVIRAELTAYKATIDDDSGPVILDFSAAPSLALTGLSGHGSQQAYTLEQVSERKLIARGPAVGGLTFERGLEMVNGYRVQVSDTFVNVTDAPVALPDYAIGIGPMSLVQSRTESRGITYLGLDTLISEGGSRVEHWGKKLKELYGIKGSRFSCAQPDARGLPEAGELRLDAPLDWVAAKNKFFVQILEPGEPAVNGTLRAVRDLTSTNHLVVASVSADLHFGERMIAPGESYTRTASYYVGPKKFSDLHKLGKYQGEIMQFGWFEWFRWLCRTLLWSLNAIDKVIPNYGIAIIIVTVVVRILFWPITHKGTESMKRMQKIQPLVTEIREKHKANPQRMNQEIMTLYKEHKVNPMGGCLPMVVQIPVFIALFTVLRSAVELRFADFLWIHDLSEPEGLLAGLLPFGLTLNILPLFMTATTIVQQRLTPSAADPQQQKIMMFMPVIFLFLFYNMASALVLYWSVSQLLAIVQLLWQRKRDNQAGAVVATPAPVAVPMPAARKRKKRKR